MGKVGSDSLAASIGDNDVSHFHTLYGNNPNDKYLDNGGFISRAKCKIRCFINRAKIRCLNVNGKIKIITLIRDPLDRDVSMFFQDLEGYVLKKRTESHSSYISFNKGGCQPLISLFDKEYDFDYGVNWLDNELKRFTGVDLYKYDVSSGVCRVITSKYDILCIKMSFIDSVEEELSEFCERDIKIKQRNLSDSKWYGCLYKDFKSEIVNSRGYYLKKYNHKKYFDWFYSDEKH